MAGRKKCYCAVFDELQFEPHVVVRTKVYADVAVQVTLNHGDSTCRPSRLYPECEVVKTVRSMSIETADPTITHTRVVSIMPLWSHAKMLDAQRNDPDISPVLKFKAECSRKPLWPELSPLSGNCKILLSNWDSLHVESDLLYRKCESNKPGAHWRQLVLPCKMWTETMRQTHDHVTAGHGGGQRTFL